MAGGGRGQHHVRGVLPDAADDRHRRGVLLHLPEDGDRLPDRVPLRVPADPSGALPGLGEPTPPGRAQRPASAERLARLPRPGDGRSRRAARRRRRGARAASGPIPAGARRGAGAPGRVRGARRLPVRAGARRGRSAPGGPVRRRVRQLLRDVRDGSGLRARADERPRARRRARRARSAARQRDHRLLHLRGAGAHRGTGQPKRGQRGDQLRGDGRHARVPRRAREGGGGRAGEARGVP